MCRTPRGARTRSPNQVGGGSPAAAEVGRDSWCGTSAGTFRGADAPRHPRRSNPDSLPDPARGAKSPPSPPPSPPPSRSSGRTSAPTTRSPERSVEQRPGDLPAVRASRRPARRKIGGRAPSPRRSDRTTAPTITRSDRSGAVGAGGRARGPHRGIGTGPWRVVLGGHLMMLVTRPAPTVRPPSRIAKRRPSSIAIGWMRSTFMSVLSPGMTISVPSGRWTTPVTSVVRK